MPAIEQRLATIEAMLRDIATQQAELHRAPRRRELSDSVKRQHITVVGHYYSGRCPCCMTRYIVIAGEKVAGHFDHWTDNPSKNSVHETWLICSQCNSDFHIWTKLRADFASYWHAYQQRRSEHFGDQLPLVLVGKTNSHKRASS